MARGMDFSRAHRRAPQLTRVEAIQRVSEQTADILKGMGKGPKYPCRRINPNSPEGRAIAARYTR